MAQGGFNRRSLNFPNVLTLVCLSYWLAYFLLLKHTMFPCPRAFGHDTRITIIVSVLDTFLKPLPGEFSPVMQGSTHCLFLREVS